MRISLVSSGLAADYGGAAQSESELARCLSGRLDIQLLCPEDRYDPKFARARGVEGLVRVFERRDLLSLSATAGLGQWLQGQDGVHLSGHWRWENGFLCRFLQRAQVPYVYHPRGMCWVGHRKVWLKKVFNQVLGNAMVRGSERVICLSQFELGQLAPYGLAPGQTTIIPNGIDVPSRWPPAKPQLPYFLYLGRVEKRKNLVDLVRAFHLYRSQGGQSLLRMVGPGEGGYDQRVSKEILKLGLEDSALLEDPVYGEQKWGLMAEAKAVVYPSRGEPFGRVPFEAVAVGGSPIVPEQSGAAEYLAPYFPELMFRLGDNSSLARALGAADRAPAGREGARQFVLNHLSWSRVGDQVIALYELVFGRGVKGQSIA